MITHGCGTTMPRDVGALVKHLAACPETGDELGAWCRAIVSAVDAMPETPVVSRDTSETAIVPHVPDIEELAILRDGGASYRDLANRAGVAPETVRRRLARHAAEVEG